MRPRAWFANLLTAVRLFLVPLVLIHAAHGGWTAACLLFAVASITDLLDGMVARAAGSSGRAGAILDLAADFALVFGTTLVLTVKGLLPPYLPVLAAFSLAAYAAACRVRGDAKRHRLGGMTGTVCIAGLWSILLAQWVGSVFSAVSVTAWLVMAACLGVSIIESAINLALHLYHARARQRCP